MSKSLDDKWMMHPKQLEEMKDALAPKATIGGYSTVTEYIAKTKDQMMRAIVLNPEFLEGRHNKTMTFKKGDRVQLIPFQQLDPERHQNNLPRAGEPSYIAGAFGMVCREILQPGLPSFSPHETLGAHSLTIESLVHRPRVSGVTRSAPVDHNLGGHEQRLLVWLITRRYSVRFC